jgi:Zn-dependent protease
LVAIVVHELAHGVVLTHHGRKVAAVGFRLHLGSPAFYVESVEALLLTRRQRLIQAAAGVWAEWQFTSVVALVLWFAPAGAWTPMLQRFVLLTVFTIATNLLPFSGLDGSLLLADLVREPNLASDSKDAIRRVGRDRRPGDRFLSVYAVANTVVSGGLLITACGFWYLLFGRFVGELTRLGPLGWTGAVALLAVSFGPAVAGLGASLRRLASVDRVAFRFERRARVRFAEQFAATAPFDRLDEHQLGILAGQLHLRRISRSRPLHEQGFAGYLVVDGPVELSRAMALGSPRVAKIDGPGVAATVTRRLARARAGLLTSASIRLLDIATESRMQPSDRLDDARGTDGRLRRCP